MGDSAVNQISQDLDWHALKLWQRDRSRKEEDRPIGNSRSLAGSDFFELEKFVVIAAERACH